ncbi:hypothetical protein GGR54DRAFT_605390 [Hypoxylon sp. NC1633]|nr:hypothetical protein GGR54DRAFT_605390 [Hypoxylon sp. NC1633]
MSQSGTGSQERALHEEYMAEFWQKEPGAEIKAEATWGPTAETRALYFAHNQQAPLGLPDIPLILPSVDRFVLIVENISLEWIAQLGVTCDIDPDFFYKHTQSPADISPWNAVFPPRYNVEVGTVHSLRRGSESWHIDGVFNHNYLGPDRSRPSALQNPNFVNRRLEYHAEYGWEAAARVSYCHLPRGRHLFLVDAPIPFPQKRLDVPMTTLHFPVSRSRGGLPMPQLFGRPRHSLFENMERFFTHDWHFDALEYLGRSASTMLYLIVASTWTYNLQHLDRTIKRLAFEEIRRPSININDQLHDCRQNADTIRTEVSSARKWIPQVVIDEVENYLNYSGRSLTHCPHNAFDEVLKESETMERFLMATFQLLMSTISVLDAEASMQQTQSGLQQARDAQRLTVLASIYLPLSLVTGIFGMNITEINDSKLPWWVSIVTLATIVACTLAIWWSYIRLERLRGRKNENLKDRTIESKG